jgi:GT2 family glycosyltransferase
MVLMTDVSAAVVSYNTRELTLRCLHATEAAATADTTLTLVDNGSSDGTVEAVRAQCPRWRVMVLSDNPGLIVTASGAAWCLELLADWRTVWQGRA